MKFWHSKMFRSWYFEIGPFVLWIGREGVSISKSHRVGQYKAISVEAGIMFHPVQPFCHRHRV